MKQDQSMEKQMGCMTGFLQIFYRHHLLSGKRIHATKRISSSSSSSSQSADSTPPQSQLQSEKLKQSPVSIKEEKSGEKFKEKVKPTTSAPSEAEVELKLNVVTPVSEFKQGFRSSWKFRESPRLSLDSRASIDGKGSLYPREIRTNAAILSATRRPDGSAEALLEEENDQKLRSPSVIARLMGLEALPEYKEESPKKTKKKQPELRRSASESRSRDVVQCKFIEGNSFQQKTEEDQRDLTEFCRRKQKSEPVLTSVAMKLQQQQQQQRKSCEDFFPEPQQTESIYGEIEKRLKMRGIDEAAKDLEALKQILEVLQLKGLLRSKKMAEQIIFDPSEDTCPVAMKPNDNSRRRAGSYISPDSSFKSRPGIRGNEKLPRPLVRPRRDRSEVVRSPSSPSRVRNAMSSDQNECNVKSPSSLVRRKALSVETPRRGNESVEQRRRSSSPAHSPWVNNARKNGADHTPRNNLRSISPRRVSYPPEDESSSISGRSISTSSQERWRTEDYNRGGENLLSRCDKLLDSIAEVTATDSQPSPISVLDSSFFNDESSPSPVKKRCIDFKDQSEELDCDVHDKWVEAISPARLRLDDNDFVYVSEILQASNSLTDESGSDVFYLLEKQQCKSNAKSSSASRVHRRLVFDTVTEILDKKRQLPPWKVVSSTNPVTGKPSFRQVWLEFFRVREQQSASVGDLLEVVCGALEKDMAGDSINGWNDCGMVSSEVVLDIERMIFKDLVGETIRDLAAFAGESRGLMMMPRSKLVF